MNNFIDLLPNVRGISEHFISSELSSALINLRKVRLEAAGRGASIDQIFLKIGTKMDESILKPKKNQKGKAG